LAEALNQLAQREQYLAMELPGWRYDVGVKYGLLTAQLALALNGQEREVVLSQLVELLAAQELGRGEN
jgi:UTP--glucose-1-phosphate uridylyltransferase